MFLTGFFFLVSMAIFLFYFVRSKNPAHYWYSGFIFSVALGLLAKSIDMNPTPHVVNQIKIVELTARFCSALSYRFSPYCLLMAGICISEIISTKYLKRIYFIFLLPVILMFFYDFIFLKQGFIYVYLDYSPTFWILGLWGVLYGLSANLIIIFGVLKEKNSTKRFQKFLLLIATLPSLFPIYTAYIFPLYGNHNYSHIVLMFAITAFTLFLFFAIRYGFLGFKINIEKSYLDSTMKLVTSGTSLLNHTIKNEIYKIEFGILNLSSIFKEHPDLKGTDFLNVILNSTQHLNDMVHRIQSHATDIKLICEKLSLKEIIQHSILSLKPLIEKYHIKIIEIYNFEPLINLDKAHIYEVLNNIIMNAVESINDSGQIIIELSKFKKQALLKIQDNGCGIPKENLPHVIKPFFTTKKINTRNYGLGLSYCYNVMIEHNGSLKIESSEGEGTTVYLSFPL